MKIIFLFYSNCIVYFYLNYNLIHFIFVTINNNSDLLLFGQ